MKGSDLKGLRIKDINSCPLCKKPFVPTLKTDFQCQSESHPDLSINIYFYSNSVIDSIYMVKDVENGQYYSVHIFFDTGDVYLAYSKHSRTLRLKDLADNFPIKNYTESNFKTYFLMS